MAEQNASDARFEHRLRTEFPWLWAQIEDTKRRERLILAGHDVEDVLAGRVQ